MGNRTILTLALMAIFLLSQVSVADNCYDAMGNSTGGYCDENTTSSARPAATGQPRQATATVTAGRQVAAQPKKAGSSSSYVVDCGGTTSLSYCVKNNITAVRCVKASNDSEAAQRCGTRSYWNLANSYGQVKQMPGVYLCSNDSGKKNICLSADSSLKLEWTATTGNDGFCYQKAHGVKDQCGFGDLAHAIVDDEDGCSKSPNMEADSQGKCVCKADYELQPSGGCKVKIVTKALTQPSGGVTSEMKKCVEDWNKIAEDCVRTSTEAESTCDQADKNNKEVKEIASLPADVANKFVQAKQGSGMLAECMKAGVLASTSKGLLGQLEAKCEANHESCTKTCKYSNAGDAQKEMYAACSKYFSKNAAGLVDDSEAAEPDANGVYYSQNEKAILEKFMKGGDVCKTDAAKNKSILSSVLNDLGNSLLKAQQCACQVAATATGTSTSSCTSLPTAAQCAADPTLTGCAAVTAIDICTQGSPNYSALGCSCQTNPKGSGCPGYVSSAGGLSGFAGTDVGNPTTSGGTTFGAGNTGGGLGSGDLNINGNHANDLAPGNKTPGVSAGFNSGGGGGGGGGLGSPPASGGEAPGGAAEGDGEGKGIGGAFGLAKSVMGSVFGGGANKTAAGVGSKTTPNLNKFRPAGMRGVASELGGKSMEIWHMMHNVYDDTQTSFISGP